MKIGIITFHWATNYGAILQAYCLQEYLKEQGHEVEIINYKPRHFDFGWNYLRRPWLLRGLRKDLVARKKEKKLVPFREARLNTTSRFFTTHGLIRANLTYDVVISGSDQVLNPSFTISGENRPTSAYYLTFAPNSKRIGYAVSFGCTEYPLKSLFYARQWINSFEAVGAREETGLSVLDKMNYRGRKKVVPDPTILYGNKLLKKVNITKPEKDNYLCVYILRGTSSVNSDNVVYIDELNNPVTMEEWLGLIIHSKGLITNSYHGMIMAILNHVPFVAVKSNADDAGMNDRFYTLLSRIGLQDRLVDNTNEYESILSKIIVWDEVEKKLNVLRSEGVTFIETILRK